MVDEQAYEHTKKEIVRVVKDVMNKLSSVSSTITTRKQRTQKIMELFAEQFLRFKEGSDVEWQFRPSIERDEKGKPKDAGFLFDLIWYSVVRKKEDGLCLFRDVALIVESELSNKLDQVQHDFLKLLGFNSMLKVAIVGCSELDCHNLVLDAMRECRYITKGRYMVWRIINKQIRLVSEFDLRWKGNKKQYRPILGSLFKDVDLLCRWRDLC